MKDLDKMKELEIASVVAVRDLLGHVPNVEVGSADYRQELGRNYQIDGRICLSHGDVSYALIIEVKSNGCRSQIDESGGTTIHRVDLIGDRDFGSIGCRE